MDGVFTPKAESAIVGAFKHEAGEHRAAQQITSADLPAEQARRRREEK